jgi:ribonuclease P protein component
MPAPTKIRRTSDFRRVLRDGVRIVGRRLTVYALRSNGTAGGFVARREVGGAVARNRARRLLREAWRQVAPGVTTPVEVVFVARPAIADSKMPEVAEEMRALLAQEGAIAT